VSVRRPPRDSEGDDRAVPVAGIRGVDGIRRVRRVDRVRR
jgi:hypothetical protein